MYDLLILKILTIVFMISIVAAILVGFYVLIRILNNRTEKELSRHTRDKYLIKKYRGGDKYE